MAFVVTGAALLYLHFANSAKIDLGTFANHSIIIVDVDTLRADHLGVYGYERDTSPSIDTFASESIRFEWAFSQAPNTPPSQASILTSLYPSSHGRIYKEDKLSPEIETLAEAFQKEGYRTAAFVDGGFMARGFGLEQGFETYDDDAGHLQVIGPKVTNWLESHLADSERKEEPFLLLIHTYDVHSPYEVSPSPFNSIFADQVQQPSEPYKNDMSGVMAKVSKKQNREPSTRLTQVELDYAIAMYDGGIRSVDHWFSGFITFLKQHDLYEKSLIVFISDHGDSFQEHSLLFHKRIYAPVSRVPMMIRLPGGQGAGVIHPVVETIDLMPTLLELAGLEVPLTLQGETLLPFLRGENPPPGLAITESPYFGRRIAVANEDFRFFYTQRRNKKELYAYRKDNLELSDIVEENPAMAEELYLEMQLWENQVEAYKAERETADELREETLQQLRTLGYIE